MANISEIKAKQSVLDYARDVLGWDVHKPGDRTYSLDRGHNKTCLTVYEDWWYDFKTGQGGDLIDLCALAKFDGDRGRAIRELGGSSPRWRAETQNLCNLVQKWHEALRPEDRQYLISRHIPADYIEKMKLGYDGARLTIPYFKNGYVAYVITRERGQGGPKYKKAALDGTVENIPWGLHTLDRKAPLVIAEGAFDAMSFDIEGYRVLSPISGYFNKDSMKQVLNVCKEGEPVFICFDSDGAGNKFQTTMAQSFFRHHITFTCGELSGVKDISDYYCAGGKLDILIAAARPGIEVLAERITDKEDFKKFVYEAGRFVGKPEMMEFLEKVKSFPAAWMKEVTKAALSAPSEDAIVKEIAQREIKYFPALGFYEYSCGVWRARDDTEIQKYIGDALGHYRTGSRVGSIFKLLKSELTSSDELDRKPIFNFRNGTLELETGKFREHSAADMSSIQCDYDYDPQAYSQRWLDFIEEVSEGDEKKSNLLQEMAGYVLFTDCSLQKCFFLLGEGANGKSVFIDVISAVFGPGNVSNIEMSGLAEPFQRIRLYSSLLNVSSETQTDVKGAESIFKQVVVGDKVNGCYKGKDFLEFRTRSKFVSACNDYIKSRDVTTGFMRRICFINFNARFVDEPGPGERKADRELTPKLLTDLQGIFNWVYSGYKILREARCFSVPADQAETLDNFAKDINPVVSFIEDEITAGEIERSVLYKNYTDWCKTNGHLAMSRTGFIRRFRDTLKQKKRKFDDIRVGSFRGFNIE
ncbi:phage/plasmid primase, P4 family [Cloacibacillus evryensis]|uniref:phage/plasmid primase, P4 family n=1 Tax=Cloacibacillus evryensis TaxID=508460 RepID=UPI002B1E93DC|nr:phage/plasmid primase, P4 family [Cloacibacillus evryensis]MEA5034198.1 phage/plasmid primase, P4 family [Cloacibacillus evryensis]